MEITVKMTDAEFLEFIDYQKEKNIFEKNTRVTLDRMELFADKICWALGHDPKNNEKVKIIDMEHAKELLDMGEDFLS